ncbi:MAG TPA: hypothetical protein VGD67_15425 [Pseudonocardiaceae bacterium]
MLTLGVLYGVLAAVVVSVLCCAASPPDGVLGHVPGMAGNARHR